MLAMFHRSKPEGIASFSYSDKRERNRKMDKEQQHDTTTTAEDLNIAAAKARRMEIAHLVARVGKNGCGSRQLTAPTLSPQRSISNLPVSWDESQANGKPLRCHHLGEPSEQVQVYSPQRKSPYTKETCLMLWFPRDVHRS